MAKEDPIYTRKCPICVWDSSPPSTQNTAQALVYRHVKDAHPEYRWFCTIPGCTYYWLLCDLLK
ncbi:hypothetical protein CYLTODRAFT_453433 [Cylindrobasidium torrendii FP15055 ss-10]|uniref:Uncharacterized protein n=1 Tax=Cylindrobasidium torrendii FP15055 ss-10 TaxID=1314674 RepID=A0A0D7BEI2_9AGAR|nr:hypothetical protein CYLTODRAFT_453433 [Cylindrobasidium torrendii FP15055 ss-10]